MKNKPTTYWIDLFCGAGGTTTGVHLSNVNTKVIACVNHDAEAIKTHYANHPECEHFTEDVRDWKVIMKLKKIVDDLRKKEPNCIINIWASLECTHFSKAKGGLARDADSRTLGDHLYYYITILNPDYLYIENVSEFLTWGPVDENGKPIKELKGVDYERWRESIQFCGYDYDHRLLNAADFGAFTSRERYFGVFAKKGLPIVFPEPTHARKNKIGDSGKAPWKAVREILDLEVEGQSIFGITKNNKPYSDKTLNRVYHGLLKFGKEGLFMKRYNGGDPANKSRSVSEPLGSILTNHTHALVRPVFLTSYYGNGGAHSTDEPCNTLTTKDRFAAHFVKQSYLMDTQFGNKGKSIDKPCQTLIARMDKKPLYLVSADPHAVDQSIPQKGDSEIKTLIRAFMREYGIMDITIRMLMVSELKAIQGFPQDYILTGTKTDQLKFIGNSVVPLMAQKLVEANYEAIAKDFESILTMRAA